MIQAEENHVGLFIDWDNLAISIAADSAGALPDVKAIVHAAQRFGMVLVARAYAEWHVMSDRLTVYRAGVEPIYAPTFRFEPDPITQAPRGKSLADPCLVTDCIDALHLHPSLTTFVLVSGDKDLIPIVRLAQLRGKRVVVIGPDYVAAILREMADEYIPYRSLVETIEPPPENNSYGPRGRRRQGSNSGRSAPPVAPTPLPAPAPVARTASAAPVMSRPRRPEIIEPVIEPAPIPEPAAAVLEPIDAVEDLSLLFELIERILREREAQGKPRLRATNLKDQLLARSPGFSERRYGFGRFKDLLAAAEKGGVLLVTQSGPVQWVTLPAPPVEDTPAPQPAIEPVVALPSPITTIALVDAPTATIEPPTSDADVVRFIADLRQRSRWLTYTYVLTNLMSHLTQSNPTSLADPEARNTLNRLVQEGILIIDREPREIDVGGTKHRVRMCHLEESHPFVKEILAQVPAESDLNDGANEQFRVAEAIGPVAETASFEAEVVAARSALIEPPWVDVSEIESPNVEPPSFHEVPRSSIGHRSGPAREAEVASAEIVDADVAELMSRSPESGFPHEISEASARTALAPATQETTGFATVGSELAARATGHSPASAGVLSSPAWEPERAVDVPSIAKAPSDERAAPQPQRPATVTLEDAFQALADVVREATGPGKPSAGAASVKTRLGKKLGTFEERRFGFGKFKDFLLAAERAGHVRVEINGPVARVLLPEHQSEGSQSAPEPS